MKVSAVCVVMALALSSAACGGGEAPVQQTTAAPAGAQRVDPASAGTVAHSLLWHEPSLSETDLRSAEAHASAAYASLTGSTSRPPFKPWAT